MTNADMKRVRAGMDAYFDFMKQTISAYPTGDPRRSRRHGIASLLKRFRRRTAVNFSKLPDLLRLDN
jgi:hypothetical protein